MPDAWDLYFDDGDTLCTQVLVYFLEVGEKQYTFQSRRKLHYIIFKASKERYVINHFVLCLWVLGICKVFFFIKYFLDKGPKNLLGTSLKSDLYQEIDEGFAHSLNGTFPRRNCSVHGLFTLLLILHHVTNFSIWAWI